MRISSDDLKRFAAAQARAWGGYFIWREYSVEPMSFLSGLLEFFVFLLITEFFYSIGKGVFIREKQS